MYILVECPLPTKRAPPTPSNQQQAPATYDVVVGAHFEGGAFVAGEGRVADVAGDALGMLGRGMLAGLGHWDRKGG